MRLIPNRELQNSKPPQSGSKNIRRSDLDLNLGQAKGRGEEEMAVDAVLGTPDVLPVMGSRRHLLLPVLHSIRNCVGWISAGAVNCAAARLDVAPAEVY